MVRELLIISSLINTPLYETNQQTSNDVLSNIFIENLGTELLNSNERISVIVQFDYEDSNLSLSNCKNYYFATNQSIVSQYDILNDYDVSSYSPFAFYNYDNLVDYELDREDLLAFISNNEDLVKFVYVDKIEIEQENNSEINSSTIDFYIDDINEICEIDNNLLTGEGINIGFVESGMPTANTNYLNNITSRTYSIGEFDVDTTHAMQTIYLASQIAPNAKIYCSAHNEKYEDFKLYNSIEWLLDNNVDIINISKDTGDSSINGLYSGHSSYVDFISNRYNKIIIKSSGNNENNTYLVTTPGTAINSLTVGGIDINKNIYINSSYDLDDELASVLNKPLLVAPAVNVGVPDNASTDLTSKTGTSFAAPIVSGIIALLMQDYPFLKSNPSLVISSLITGANPINNNGNWNEKSGAGIISFKNTDIILTDLFYSTGTNFNNPIGTTILNKEISISANSELSIGISRSASPLVEKSTTNLIGIPKLTNYVVKIYEEDVLLESFTFEKDNDLFKYINGDSISKDCSIKVEVYGTFNSYIPEEIAISFNYTPHSHSLTTFIKKNEKVHTSKCGVCSYETTQPHEINASDVGKDEAQCIRCRSTIDLIKGMAIVAGPFYIIRYSKNGSYIHPSGIVVLVDEDIEDYHNGTLEFIYTKNDNEIY